MPPPVSPLPPPPPPAGTTPGSLGGLLGAVSVDFGVGPVEDGSESLVLVLAGEGPVATCTPFPLTSEGPVGAITLFAGACEEPVPLLPPPEDDGAPDEGGDEEELSPPDDFAGDAFWSSLFGISSRGAQPHRAQSSRLRR